jgi:hypothetical protein
MKRTPGVLTLPRSRGVVTKIGILWIAECRDISLEVVLSIVNERRGVNDEGAYLQCRPLGRNRNRHPCVLQKDTPPSHAIVKSAAACFVIEHRQLGGKVVAPIGNVMLNDRKQAAVR